ncbi:phage holin family protein [Thermoactinomyces mirandus]|uniref:Phage holin family protein n=1 Tax=Thermoactinomyces mirandus TaxID=2756294 RepID=A0A7W1XUH8_9BACL|nr:phage holin family protein [Thermoactinomyces mirandus]MBA4603528.1 phage holin family protein [Thermoactinomyces mirandus]
MKILLKIVAGAVAVFLASEMITGIKVESWKTAFLAAIVLAVINLVIRPLLIFLTLPINILTLGLFSLVINALMFWLTGSLVEGFFVDGFVPAFLGALIMTIANWIVNRFVD